MMLTDGMDLQLFAEEKTEKATPKKRREARERGQVFRSIEFNSAIVLIAGFLVLRLLSSFMHDKLRSIYIQYLGRQLPTDELFTPSGIAVLNQNLIYTLITVLMPVLSLLLIAGLAVNYWQVGFLFTTRPLVPNLNRLNPVEGFKRILSKRALAELLKSLLKLAIIVYVAYSELSDKVKTLTRLTEWDLYSSISYISETVFKTGIKIAVILLLLAIFDYFYQWWEYEKSLRMTKHELKEEYKQVEGDPLIRSKVRERQRQLGMRRMMQEIPRADVVITNPVHYAVALRYEPNENDAPVVVAKGQDYLALKIKEIAKENNVTVVQNRSLAQALYRSTEIGQTIPPELFHAVAEVLAYVYSIKGKQV
ncbi:MAG: flagellar biosynthesis protein FlhB [Clostridiales bacterium]|jgi:flagellar biosynthetic protein FlhB|nr:flagellar biosynthesis protein FlhB [Clostridiales bacterium]